MQAVVAGILPRQSTLGLDGNAAGAGFVPRDAAGVLCRQVSPDAMLTDISISADLRTSENLAEAVGPRFSPS